MSSKRKSTLQQGLLDLSLIVEGKRMRKPVKRFVFETTASESSSDGDVVTLGSFEKVKQSIMFAAVDQLKPLHKILFGTVGRPASLKREIENFRGFSFTVGSANYKKAKAALEKLSNDDLLTMKTALDVESSYDKHDMVCAILEFLMTLKKPETPKKRLSDENEIGSSEAKKPRQSESPGLRSSKLQLSESSSDEDEHEEEKVIPAKAAKPKKRVSFEDEHRPVHFGEAKYGDTPRRDGEMKFAQCSLLPTPEKIAESRICEELQLERC